MLFLLWDMKQLWSALAYGFLHAGWLTQWVTHIFSWMFFNQMIVLWWWLWLSYLWRSPFQNEMERISGFFFCFFFLSDETSSTKQSPRAQQAESESQFLPQTRMQIKKDNNWKFKWDQLKHTDTLTHTDTVSRRRVAMTPDEGGACRNNKCGVTGNLAACGSAAAVVWAGCCSARNKHTSNCPSGTGSRCGRATVSQSSAKHEIN